MGRSRALILVGTMVVALAACGGGGDGGDENAFCDSLDALSEQVADGDLSSNNGLEDAVDTANDLLEVASDDQQDAVTNVGELLSEADPDDATDTANEIQDQLGDLADDCSIDEFAEAPEEETTTTTEAEPTTTTEGIDEETTTTDGGDVEVPDQLNPVTAVLDPAAVGVEPGFEDNIDLCFQGLMVACDDIFFGENGQEAAPDGSVARQYAATCGGRINSFVNDSQRCVENLFGAGDFDVTTFDDPSFEAVAQACKGDADTDVLGDMAACDTLFATTPVGSQEELYGRTCGFRIGVPADRDPAVTTCVAIFGAQAAFG